MTSISRMHWRISAPTQRPWGSWYGRWGVNHIYGTWCVVSALVALHAGADMVRNAAAWMLRVQNPDGGWGETCHSYVDESFAGVGTSTPSQTAWAMLTLQLAGLGDDPACARGRAFLLDRQRDGTWDEPEHTGTGFPGDFYINYHLYRHVFPTLALAGGEPPRPARPQPSASSSPTDRTESNEGDSHGGATATGDASWELRGAATPAPQREVRAGPPARTAVSVQPRVRRLREDPARGSHPPAASHGAAVHRRRRGVRGADGVDRRRRAAGAQGDRPDRRRARRAQALRVSLHQRAAAREEAASLHAVAVLLVLDPHRRAARASRRVRSAAPACSTRRSPPSPPPRRAASG